MVARPADNQEPFAAFAAAESGSFGIDRSALSLLQRFAPRYRHFAALSETLRVSEQSA
jgi:hypothetical protein